MFMDLEISEFSSKSRHNSSKAAQEFKKRNENLCADLELYLLDKENKLSAEEIERHLFPSIQADIFISHAHKDEDNVIELAVALESLGLKVFVDSCVWGHADKLLKEIDEKYCLQNNAAHGKYNYKLRNRSTSNVYMILNSALHSMIDKAELFIFLETENSVKIENYFKDPAKLSSPWIFSELSFAEKVRRTPRRTITYTNENFDSATASTELLKSEQGPTFYYNLPKLTHKIKHSELLEWLSLSETKILSSGTRKTTELDGLNALDDLYKRLKVDSKHLATPRLQSNTTAAKSWRNSAS